MHPRILFVTLLVGLVLLGQTVTFGVVWTITTPTATTPEDHNMAVAVGGTSDYTLDATMWISIWQDEMLLNKATTDYDSSSNKFGPDVVNPGSPPNNDFEVGEALAKVRFFNQDPATAAPLDDQIFTFN